MTTSSMVIYSISLEENYWLDNSRKYGKQLAYRNRVTSFLFRSTRRMVDLFGWLEGNNNVMDYAVQIDKISRQQMT